MACEPEGFPATPNAKKCWWVGRPIDRRVPHEVDQRRCSGHIASLPARRAGAFLQQTWVMANGWRKRCRLETGKSCQQLGQYPLVIAMGQTEVEGVPDGGQGDRADCPSARYQRWSHLLALHSSALDEITCPHLPQFVSETTNPSHIPTGS